MRSKRRIGWISGEGLLLCRLLLNICVPRFSCLNATSTRIFYSRKISSDPQTSTVKLLKKKKVEPLMTAKDPGPPSRTLGTSIRGAAATILSLALDALVGADGRPHALLTLPPAAVMLEYLRSAAFLAVALHARVGAYLRPQALQMP